MVISKAFGIYHDYARIITHNIIPAIHIELGIVSRGAIPQESGNPAVDDLRERLADLAGITLADFFEEGKGTGLGGQAQAGKGRGKVRARL